MKPSNSMFLFLATLLFSASAFSHHGQPHLAMHDSVIMGMLLIGMVTLISVGCVCIFRFYQEKRKGVIDEAGEL